MDAWYSVMSMGFGYLSALMILIIVVAAFRKYLGDQRLWRNVRREKRQIAMAGELAVLSGGSRRQGAGTMIGVPYEGTVGSASGCDIILSARKLHLRSAFFWIDRGRMHLVPVTKDRIEVDGEPVHPGDEAIMRTGAELSMNDVRMKLTLYESASEDQAVETPYVTKERQARAHRGKGRGIGNSGSAAEEEKPGKRKKSRRE